MLQLGDHGPPPDREPLGRMLAALSHRGPDEQGLYLDNRVGLAHTRLSVIDPDTGQQPMSNEDEGLWVVFNGEIFNYIELGAELSARGHRLRTRSDTEVIVHAWEEWGEDCFARMNGQWALALWDARQRRLVLARDRLGIRPLYYAEHRGRLVFASEVKALFAAEPGMSRSLDPAAMSQTFTFWTAVPPRTVFAGVREVEPGHVRVYHDGAVRDRAYWSPVFPETRALAGSVDEAARAVRAALAQATELRMTRADVPVGSYLSGGLDSSLVATLGAAATSARIHTFAIRFADTEYDETPYQRLVARAIGAEHHELLVQKRDIAEALPGVVYHAERPILRTAPAPLFLLSRLVRETGIKVVLTGEGADEIFAGYDLFREGAIRRFWAREPGSATRPLLLQRLYPYLARSPVAQKALAMQFFGQNLGAWQTPGFAHETRWRTTSALRRLFAPDFAGALRGFDPVAELLGAMPPESARFSPLAQDQYLEMRTLLSGYLLSAQGDRMLMAHSVEGRFPFLDRDVVELAAALPDSYKLRGLHEKYVLKRAAHGLVPDLVRRRVKQPYRAPDAAALASADRPPWIDEILGKDAVTRAGVFAGDAVQALWKKCRSHAAQGIFSNTDNMALVGVVTTQLLHETLITRVGTENALPVAGRIIDRRGI